MHHFWVISDTRRGTACIWESQHRASQIISPSSDLVPPGPMARYYHQWVQRLLSVMKLAENRRVD